MSTQLIDFTSHFTLDHEPASFAIYQNCSGEGCTKRLPVDDLEEGMCPECHKKYMALDEKEYFLIVSGQRRCLNADGRKSLGEIQDFLIEQTGEHDIQKALEQLGAIIVVEV